MSLENEMERIGKIVAADQGIEVTVRGTLPYWMPGRVNIPNVEHFSWLGRDAKRMLHGLLDHETAHAVFTNPDIPIAALAGDERTINASDRKCRELLGDDLWRRVRKHASPALKSLVNAAEDAWIEREQGRRYPGARQNLHTKNRWYLERSPDAKTVLGGDDPIAAFMLAATLIGRGSASIDEFSGYPELHETLCKARKIFMKMERCRTSVEAVALGVEMFELFDPPEPPEPEEEKGGSGGDEGDEEGTEGDPEDEGDEEGTEGDPEDEGDEEGTEGDPEDEGDEEGTEGDPEDEGDEEGTEGDPEDEGDEEGTEGDPEDEGDEEGDVEACTIKTWEASPSPLNPEDSVEKIVRQLLDESRATGKYINFSHEFDFECDLTDVPFKGLPDWQTLLDESQIAADVITQAFEVALRARREKRPVQGADEGQVDPEALGEYAVGARMPDTMYTHWAAEDETDVVVSVLIDCSGSMGACLKPGSRSRLAAVTATAMHRALSAVQITHEISGFTSIDSRSVDHHPWIAADPAHGKLVKGNFARMREGLLREYERGVDVYKYAREIYRAGGSSPASGLLMVPTHAVFKSFGATDGRGICWVDGIHENLDGESVLWQARRLAQRPERRRVMFVLTDGQPCGSRDELQGSRYLREVVDWATASGIEVYAVGIMSDHVEHYYPRSWVAHTVEELCDVAMTSMAQVLIEGRQEQRWVTLG